MAGNPFASVLNNSSGFGANGKPAAPAAGFASDASFTSAFGGNNDNSAAGNCYTCVILKAKMHIKRHTFLFPGLGASFFGDILQPQNSFPTSTPASGGMVAPGGKPGGPVGKLVSGDLDASLANLTSNLNLGIGHGK